MALFTLLVANLARNTYIHLTCPEANRHVTLSLPFHTVKRVRTKKVLWGLFPLLASTGWLTVVSAFHQKPGGITLLPDWCKVSIHQVLETKACVHCWTPGLGHWAAPCFYGAVSNSSWLEPMMMREHWEASWELSLRRWVLPLKACSPLICT